MESLATPTSRAGARPGRARPRAQRQVLTGFALPTAALLCLVLLAGCGGSSSPGVAHVGNASSTTPASGGSGGGVPESKETGAAAQQRLVKFSQCMRTHGEPEFPEPSEGGIQIHSHNGQGVNPESPQFQAAEKACKQYAPVRQAPSPAQQAKMQEQALKFSECMRHNGVPNFPTPEFSSGGRVRMRLKAGKSTGIEPGSAQFQSAQKACQSDSPLKGLKGPGPVPAGAGPKGGGAQSSQSVGP